MNDSVYAVNLNDTSGGGCHPHLSEDENYWEGVARCTSCEFEGLLADIWQFTAKPRAVE